MDAKVDWTALGAAVDRSRWPLVRRAPRWRDAGARPTDADRDGRPNILVVMTDDMAPPTSS